MPSQCSVLGALSLMRNDWSFGSWGVIQGAAMAMMINSAEDEQPAYRRMVAAQTAGCVALQEPVDARGTLASCCSGPGLMGAGVPTPVVGRGRSDFNRHGCSSGLVYSSEQKSLPLATPRHLDFARDTRLSQRRPFQRPRPFASGIVHTRIDGA